MQPSVERPFEKGGESQKMVVKDPIGFKHEFGEVNSCWTVEDRSLVKSFIIEPFDYFDSYLQVYDMEFLKAITKLDKA